MFTSGLNYQFVDRISCWIVGSWARAEDLGSLFVFCCERSEDFGVSYLMWPWGLEEFCDVGYLLPIWI